MTVRIGLLTDGTMARWKIKALRNAVNLNDAVISAVVVDDSKSKTTKNPYCAST